jgi:hypothetical protein
METIRFVSERRERKISSVSYAKCDNINRIRIIHIIHWADNVTGWFMSKRKL